MTGETSLVVVENDGGFEALCEVRHPMDENNYLTQLVFRVDNQIHSEFLLGRFVSANPVLGIPLSELARGTRIEVRWQDIGGRSGSASLVYPGQS